MEAQAARDAAGSTDIGLHEVSYCGGCEPSDIGKTIHPHPTLGESIGVTAEVFEGHCTDLQPQRKK